MIDHSQFHQNLYLKEEEPLLRNMTAEEKIKFEEAQKEISGEKEVFDTPWFNDAFWSWLWKRSGFLIQPNPHYVAASLET